MNFVCALKYLWVLILCAVTSACITVPDRTYQVGKAEALLANPVGPKLAPPLGTVEPLVVEIDDEGGVNPTQRKALLESVDLQNTADSLLLFVHGWHHNAAID